MRVATPIIRRLTLSIALLCLVRDVGAVTNYEAENEPIIDSQLSFDESMIGIDVPRNLREQLCLISVRYYSFDGLLHQGQLIVHRKLKREVLRIFLEIEKSRFPILKVIPISKYNFSDRLSMLDNNTSAFNYRPVKGTNVLSRHALGRAIDINPFLNPVIRNGTIEPEGARYDPRVYGTILKNGVVAQAFKKRGWRWGGDWRTLKDYQHFEK